MQGIYFFIRTIKKFLKKRKFFKKTIDKIKILCYDYIKIKVAFNA